MYAQSARICGMTPFPPGTAPLSLCALFVCLQDKNRESEDEEGDEDRIDQQMGDVGDNDEVRPRSSRQLPRTHTHACMHACSRTCSFGAPHLTSLAGLGW